MLKESFEILGVMLDTKGSSTTSISHRLVSGQQLWHIHRAYLLNRKISLKTRLKKYYTTVGRTSLWGAGGWTLTKANASMLERADNHHRETFVDFIKRSTRVARGILKRYGFSALLEQVLIAHHRWLGHVARTPQGRHFYGSDTAVAEFILVAAPSADAHLSGSRKHRRMATPSPLLGQTCRD